MITLNEVKQAITDGTCQRIYLSSGSLWWTHDDKDVEAATLKGVQRSLNRSQAMLADPKVSEDHKKKLRAALAMVKQPKHQIPLDPFGAPLYQQDGEHMMGWLKAAEDQPNHFGKYQLAAFMVAHHQNCQDRQFTSWAKLTAYMEFNMHDPTIIKLISNTL